MQAIEGATVGPEFGPDRLRVYTLLPDQPGELVGTPRVWINLSSVGMEARCCISPGDARKLATALLQLADTSETAAHDEIAYAG